MGLFSSIKNAVKKVVKTAVNVATGGYYGSREQRKANAAAQRQADTEAARQQELSNQDINRNRQESADLGALNGDGGPGSETAGVLTGPVGLVDDRKLSSKKKLGGGK